MASLTVTGIADSTEPYVTGYHQTLADVRSFGQHLSTLTDRSLTVTFNDNATVDVRNFQLKVLAIGTLSIRSTVYRNSSA